MILMEVKHMRYPKVEETAVVFLPDMLPQVRAVARRGLSDDEIAVQFGVSPHLFQKWKDAYPDFAQAIKDGRSHAVGDVVMALHKRATGYNYTEEALTRSGSIKKLKRHALPDVPAIKYYLNNRDPLRWRETARVEHTGGPAGTPPVKIETRNELIMSIVKMIPSKPD